MDGFARRKERSKDEIRKAAWELFSQFGVGKTSIADIAKKAGVSQATIYNNFGSKQALAREFVSAAVDQLMTRVQEVLVPSMLYQEKMNAVIQFISEAMEGAPPSAAVFAGSLDLLNDPEIKEIRGQAQEKMIGLLLGLIEEGKQQGQVNSSLSEDSLRIYLALFLEVFINPELGRQFHRHPEMVGELGSMLMYGLCG